MYDDYGSLDGGFQMNTGMGVYTAGNQLNMSPEGLMQLGFTAQEIQTLQYIVNCGGKATVASMTQCGVSYEEANRIKYLYDIVTGRIAIDTEDQLVKHLKKMFGGGQKIGIQNLKLSRISIVPRKCVIGGIPNNNPFCIYNSINQPRERKMYNVKNVTAGKVYIETGIIPKLPYGDSKKLLRVTENSTGKSKYVRTIDELPKSIRSSDEFSINTVADIKEILGGDEKKLTIAFDSQYAKVCNRFIIVGSLKRPEFHHGMVEIICIEGTKVYVYAKTASMAELVKYSGGTQRVYDYGFTGGEIQSKLMAVASDIYKCVSGVYASTAPANSDFVVIPKEQKIVNDEELLENRIED